MSFCCPATAGTDYGRWGGYGGTAPDLAIDQRREDGQSLCFDTDPLTDGLELLGAAEVDLEISVDKPLVNMAVRLCDVFPDGTSAVFTYGVLNLSHRNSHEHPEPCPIGKPFRIKIRLNDIGRTIPKGHRLRLALQNQFWFILWPQPELSTFSIEPGTSTLRLPVRPNSPDDSAVGFEPPEISRPAAVDTIREGGHSKIVEDDLAAGLRTIRLNSDFGAWRLAASGIESSALAADTFEIHANDPLSAKLSSTYEWSFKSGPANCSARARTEIMADAAAFHLKWSIEAKENGQIVFTRTNECKIPRDFC